MELCKCAAQCWQESVALPGTCGAYRSDSAMIVGAQRPGHGIRCAMECAKEGPRMPLARAVSRSRCHYRHRILSGVDFDASGQVLRYVGWSRQSSLSGHSGASRRSGTGVSSFHSSPSSVERPPRARCGGRLCWRQGSVARDVVHAPRRFSGAGLRPAIRRRQFRRVKTAALDAAAADQGFAQSSLLPSCRRTLFVRSGHSYSVRKCLMRHDVGLCFPKNYQKNNKSKPKCDKKHAYLRFLSKT